MDRLRSKLLLGLMGSAIQASRSPTMYEREGEAQGVRCLYQLLDLEVLKLDAGAIPELLKAAELMRFRGLNVTHPCKQAVMAHLTEIHADAKALGAVNAVILEDGKRIGYNTDWFGFHESFKRGLPDAALDHVVQFGAGGAGSATAYALMKLGVKRLTLIEPDEPKASALMERLNPLFGGRIGISKDVAESVNSADGVVNATPLGMFGHPGVAVPKQLLRSSLWVAEIVYFPRDTELLQLARAAGCRTVDGSWMAVYQAAENFQMFFKMAPDVERMHRFFEEFEGPGK